MMSGILVCSVTTHRLELVFSKVRDEVANEERNEATKVDKLVHEEGKHASDDERVTALIHAFPELLNIVQLWGIGAHHDGCSVHSDRKEGKKVSKAEEETRGGN